MGGDYANWYATFRSLLKVGVGHLGVVVILHFHRMADPVCHHVGGMGLKQFGFARRPQVVEELGPRHHAGRSHDSLELRAKVGFAVPIPGDDERVPRRGLLKRIEQRFQVWPQFGEHRHHARLARLLRFVNEEPGKFKIDVFPADGQMLAGATQAAETREGEQQAPFQVLAASGQHFGGLVAGYKVRAFLVSRVVAVQAVKRISRQQLPMHGIVEELLGQAHAATRRVFRQARLLAAARVTHQAGRRGAEPFFKVLGIAHGNGSEGPLGRKECKQRAFPFVVIRKRPLIPVRRAGHELVEVCPKRKNRRGLQRGPRRDEPDFGQPLGEFVGYRRHPAGRFGVDGQAVQRVE